MVPAQVGGDELAILGIFDAAHAGVGPAFEGGQVAVAFRQHTMGDEQGTQVLATVGHQEGRDRRG